MLRNLLNSIQERKKSVNRVGDIPRASGFVWTPITPVSRNGRRRREPIQPDTPGISGEDPYADSSRVASESNVGEGSTNERSPPLRASAISRKKNEGRNRTPRSEFAASSCPTRILPTSFVEWNDRFEFPSWEGKVKRWLSRRNFMFFVR